MRADISVRRASVGPTSVALRNMSYTFLSGVPGGIRRLSAPGSDECEKTIFVSLSPSAVESSHPLCGADRHFFFV